MPGKKHSKWKKEIIITEGGTKDYRLKLELFKTQLNIEDEEGNKIAVDKRDDKIKIQRWGDVEFHRAHRKKIR